MAAFKRESKAGKRPKAGRRVRSSSMSWAERHEVRAAAPAEQFTIVRGQEKPRPPEGLRSPDEGLEVFIALPHGMPKEPD